MSRVLFVDISVKGHRLKYMQAINVYEHTYYLLPEDNRLSFSYIKMKSEFHKKRTLQTYKTFIHEINTTVKNNDIDDVIFLCGDALYRYFGIELNSIKAELFITFHHMTFEIFKKISLKKIFSKIKYGVVHTKYLQKKLFEIGISNVKCIEYPVFSIPTEKTANQSKKYFGLKENKTCFVMIGGTQQYKGVDILLKALQGIQKDFQVFISGVERDLKEQDILEAVTTYRGKVVLLLRELSDEEYQMALNAADYIVLPYRYEFNGASGPLVDSTVYRKPIIAAKHGSLGKIVKENHLGVVFATEDIAALQKEIYNALNTTFHWDNIAETYRSKLSVVTFKKKYKMLIDE